MNKQSLMLVNLVLIMTVAISISGCKDSAPDLNPYLNHPDASGMCPRYKLVDKTNLVFQYDSMQKCSDIVWGLPSNQLETWIAWGRREIKGSAKVQSADASE
jgi:hypothetical protein